MASAEARLRRLLGRAELGWLVDRLERRLELGRPLTGTLVRNPATEAERAAVDALLGRARRTATGTSVRLEELAVVLRRAGLAESLAEAIVALRGPIRSVAAEREHEEALWSEALAVLDRAAADHPGLTTWPADLRSTGLLRRLARDPAEGMVLAQQAAAVLGALPASGVPLSVLAARMVHDGHALDTGRPLATLVLRAVAVLSALPAQEQPRTLWAAVGVLSGELNNPVLTLNLDCHPGEPVHFTVRQLVRDPPRWSFAERTVFVCENPAVVAIAADELGTGCAPLVCVRGYPAAAATMLLRQLGAAGARLTYHGDFDWPGVGIASLVLERFGAQPWRFDEPAYREAAAAGGRSLNGRPVPTPWDPGLATAMRTLGVKVEEERILDNLLADLT